MTEARPRCPKCGKDVVKAGRVHHHGSMTGQQRWMHGYAGRKICKWHGTQPVGLEATESQGIDPKTAKSLHVQVRRAKRAIYVITAAQNATPVNKPFFAALQLYCRKRNATLLVIPYRYKNPTSRWSQAAEDDDWWAPELAAHLIDIRTVLNPNLVLLADIKTQPTASTPLTGFETISGDRSAIIGHPKLELTTVPAPQSKMAKILTTTGAVTEKNYIPSKAGKKGEFHHTFGAALVEIDGKRFHLRQINAGHDGSFQDLDTIYQSDGKTRKGRADLVLGDEHVDFADPGVIKARFGKGGMCETLKPTKLVRHDILDFHSATHHDRHDPFKRLAKFNAGLDNVEAELDRCYAHIDRYTPPGVQNIVVASNHHEHLAKYVRDTDPRDDLRNCVFLAKTFIAMAEGSKCTELGAVTIDPFAWWAKYKLKCIDRTRFLARNESHLIRGIEVSFHGDQGSNGARGNIKGFAKIGVKTVTAHTHTPGIRDGAVQVGGGTRLGLAWLGGPSSWLHCDCAIYETGKRSLLFIVDGHWRQEPAYDSMQRRSHGGTRRVKQKETPDA